MAVAKMINDCSLICCHYGKGLIQFQSKNYSAKLSEDQDLVCKILKGVGEQS